MKKFPGSCNSIFSSGPKLFESSEYYKLRYTIRVFVASTSSPLQTDNILYYPRLKILRNVI